MSSPQTLDLAALAEQFAAIQPPAIARRLLGDAEFRKAFGILVDMAVVYEGGPPIRKRTMYGVIRAVLEDGQTRHFASLDGQGIEVRLENDKIFVSFAQGETGHANIALTQFLFLSIDAAGRLNALERLTDEIGTTGPAPEDWRERLAAAPLDDDSMEAFSDELEDSLPFRINRIQHDISNGCLDKAHLIPTSIGYWERLCGRCPDGLSQEDWLRGAFSSHRKRLIARDLLSGLDLCLAMNINDELMPRHLVEGVSNDGLWKTIENLGPVDDPFSLLGIVDLAASRAHADERFAGLTEMAVQRLCADTLRRADGMDVLALFPAVLDLVLTGLQVTPGIAARPGYWRRTCGWTQAALILRILRYSTFDPTEFAAALAQLQSPRARISELLELQDAPLWHPSDTGKTRIRAEIIGRLLILRDREAAAGRTLPGVATLNDAVDALAESFPLGAYFPGPLEVHRLPIINLANVAPEARADLVQRSEELTTDLASPDWARFSHLCRLMRFDDAMISRMTQLIETNVPASSRDLPDRVSLLQLGPVAFIAVAQRSAQLADAVLTRCLHEVDSQTDAAHASALMKMGLIAMAAFEDQKVGLDRLAKYLLDLSRLVPVGEPCQSLLGELQLLKVLTAAAEWHRFSRAEAMLGLGA